jgi:hypothetical protein
VSPTPADDLGMKLAKENDVVNLALHGSRLAKAPTLVMETIRRAKDTTSEPRKLKTVRQQVRLEGDIFPKLEKPLTDALRERERLIKRFGVVAIDILHYADGKLTVNEIVAKAMAERSTVENILDFAEKLGILEFKQKE